MISISISNTDAACLKALCELSGERGWQFFRHPKPSYGIYVRTRRANSGEWTSHSHRQTKRPREEEFIDKIQKRLGTVGIDTYFSDETDMIRVVGWNRTPELVKQLLGSACDGTNVDHRE
jgi:hypothetical protein